MYLTRSWHDPYAVADPDVLDAEPGQPVSRHRTGTTAMKIKAIPIARTPDLSRGDSWLILPPLTLTLTAVPPGTQSALWDTPLRRAVLPSLTSVGDLVNPSLYDWGAVDQVSTPTTTS
jgi:hypothetical protein